MTNLLEAAAAEAKSEAAGTTPNPKDALSPETSPEPGAKPESGAKDTGSKNAGSRNDVPEKFLDPATGEVRVDALAKSYRALERKLSQVTANKVTAIPETDGSNPANLDLDGDGIPDGPDGYDVQGVDGLDVDADANAFFHQIGLTRGQARELYRFAADSIVPRIRELQGQRATAESAGARTELAGHFGSDEAFTSAAPEILAWARANLPARVRGALSESPTGIIALHKMMQDEDPALLVDGAAAASLSQKQLEKIMDSPKFWRDQDPKTVKLVHDGFARLYPG